MVCPRKNIEDARVYQRLATWPEDNAPVLPRCLARDVGHDSRRVSLPADEADHLTRVLRLTAGARVRVFNGRGDEFEGVLDDVARGRAAVVSLEPCAAAAEARIAVTLAQAVLKGDKMDDVVRDAVMIGAAAVQPVVSARAEISTAALTRGHRRERWERIAVASAKQCGRAIVPPVHPPVTLDEALAAVGGALPAPAWMLMEPRAGVPPETPRPADSPIASTVFIGPEGGWTPEEAQRARARCRPLTLGQRTLRADAAGLVAMSALLAIWDGY
jgi:16S rRNA (uracil1498-N3)-methyltransferase